MLPQFRIWLQTLGYFMCFGTIVAKMWRIYFIFYHPRVKITNAKQMVYSSTYVAIIAWKFMDHTHAKMFADCQGLAPDNDSGCHVLGCGDYLCHCGNMGAV